jgi:hypothetical protein
MTWKNKSEMKYTIFIIEEFLEVKSWEKLERLEKKESIEIFGNNQKKEISQNVG